MKKKQLISLFTAAAATVCLLTACQSSAPSPSADPEPLSAEEVAQLQKSEYPLSSGSANASFAQYELTDFVDGAHVPVYGEWTGEATDRDDFFHVPFKVLHDPTGKYEEGTEMALYSHSAARGLVPIGEPGERFVAFMQDCDEENQDDSDLHRVFFLDAGFYYVTDDGHVIAAYEESDAFRHSGEGLATLLEAYETLLESSADAQ